MNWPLLFLLAIALLIAILMPGLLSMSLLAGVVGMVICLWILQTYFRPVQRSAGLSALFAPSIGTAFAEHARTTSAGEVLIPYQTYKSLRKRFVEAGLGGICLLLVVLIGLRTVPVPALVLVAPIALIMLALATWALFGLITNVPRGERLSMLKTLVIADPRYVFAQFASTTAQGELKVGYTTYKRLVRATSVLVVLVAVLAGWGLLAELRQSQQNADQNVAAALAQLKAVTNTVATGQGDLKQQLGQLLSQSLQPAPTLDQNSLTARVLAAVTKQLPAAPVTIENTAPTNQTTQETVIQENTQNVISLSNGATFIFQNQNQQTFATFDGEDHFTIASIGTLNMKGAFQIDSARVSASAEELNLTSKLDNTTSGDEGARYIGTRSANFTNFSPSRDDVEAALAAIDTAIGTTNGAAAPSNATYLTLSTNSTLTSERTLAVGSGLSLTDGGANSSATIAFNLGLTPGVIPYGSSTGNLTSNTSALFWDTTNSRLGIGTTAPATHIESVTNGAADFFVATSYGAGGTSFIGQGARGPMSSPSASQADDTIMNVGGRGYGSTGFSSSSQGILRVSTGEIWTDSAQGTYITLRVSPTGSASAAEQVRIDNAGRVGIGSNNPTSKLRINGTGGTFSAAGVSELTSAAQTVTLSGANPTTYATFHGNQFQPMTLAGTNAGQTVTDAATFQIVSAVVKSTNVAITNSYGLKIEPGTLSGVTTSYGMFVDAPTGATDNYGLVVNSGNVGFGTTAPTNSLSFGTGSDQKIWIENSATDVPGRDLTIAGGATVTGTSTSNVAGGALTFTPGLGTGNGSSTIYFKTATPVGSGTTLQTLSTKMTLLNGLLGIGTTTPTYELEISPSTGVTPGQTWFIRDALATTGATTYRIQAGAGQSTTALEVFQNSAGSTIGSVSASGQIIATSDGAATKVVAGTCSDSNFTTLNNGLICVDSTDGRIYYRRGGTWHYTTKTAGFQIPNLVTDGKNETEGLAVGDYVIGRLNQTLEDGALHGLYEKFDPTTLIQDQLRGAGPLDQLKVLATRLDTLEGKVLSMQDNQKDPLTNNSPDSSSKDTSKDKTTEVPGLTPNQIKELIFSPDAFFKGAIDIEKNLTVKANATVYGTLIADSIEVTDAFTTNGEASFLGKATFEDSATVSGTLSLSNQQAGFAQLPAGTTEATITFPKAFSDIPLITLNVEDGLASVGVFNKSKTEFTIKLDQPLTTDIQVSWSALIIPDAQTTTAKTEAAQ